MENNIKIEPLTTEQKETLVSGLFSMMSKENTQFISKEKYDELEQYNMKLKDKVEQLQDRKDTLEIRIDKAVEYIKAVGVRPKEIDSFVLLNILKGDNK